MFGPGRVAIFSNSAGACFLSTPTSPAGQHASRPRRPRLLAGSSDDASFADARRLSSALGLPVVEHGTKKPAGADALFSHLGHRGREVAFVGDRVLTDIVFGNLHGA